MYAQCIKCNAKLTQYLSDIFDSRFGINKAFNVGLCPDCGLVQIVPLPSPGELKKLYETYYNFGEKKDNLYSKLRERFLFSGLYRFWMTIDGDMSFHNFKGSGRLIDIGCNEGRGLRIYRRNGFETEGLELNELAALKASKGGFRVYTELLESFYPKDLYDVAVLSHVLEHSLQPKDMLKHVARILKPGGEVWISCPNVDSWQRRFFGKLWLNWHVPFHIVHFSRNTLNRLLQDAGFEIKKVRQESPALWVAQSLIVRLFARQGLPTKQLRNPLLVASLMLLVRGLFFPVLWLGNRLRCGDCIVVVAKKVCVNMD